MKKIKWIFPIFFLFFTTGCYNYRELNQLALTSAIGIDQTENGYIVTMQILNTQKQGSDTNSGGDQPKFVIYQHEGKTIQQALREVILESPRRLYVNHIDMLLIGEKVAKNGIQDILDFFSRNVELRKQFLVVINREKDTEEILKVLTPLEVLNSKNIRDSILADVKYYGMSSKVTFEHLLDAYLDEKTALALPTVSIKGNEKKGEEQDNIKTSTPETSIILDPLAVINDGHFIGYLNKSQSRVYNYINGNVNNSIATFSCEDNRLYTIEINEAKTKRKVDVSKPKITITISSSASIKEISCDVDLTDPKVITELEKQINKDMKEEMEKDIKDVISLYHADIFGFEDAIYKSSPKKYKEWKNKYGDELIDMIEYEVDMRIKILAKGNIIRVIQ